MFELLGIHNALLLLLCGDLNLNGNSHSKRVIGNLDVHRITYQLKKVTLFPKWSA